ncbi:MAG: sulfurtransferase/chromate resistance protein [Alphaproteobacteria bacterium]|nr:sulfurtransferase/chromate resistance protein [Alphaproteobacteria bacterium]
MASPTEITVQQLNRLVGTPDGPILVDLRIDEDAAADPDLIPGAFRWPHTDADTLAARLGGRKTVVYCQKGKKISQGTAAILRTLGVPTETLAGGHFAWRDAGLPRIPEAALPRRDAQGRTVWVTRQRPKIDRIACPWLIRRFVDPSARFLFVPAADVLAVAEKFDATPFDIDGVTWSHRGEKCTFDMMVETFCLHSDAMDRLAVIVRGADTDRHDLAPEAAGLLAASLGLSRMYRDDLAQLDASMGLYDAFYRWARDAVDERHDWPAGAKVG